MCKHSLLPNDMGVWFVAYLVHKEGKEKLRINFYNDLNKSGFKKSFKKNFEKSTDEYIKEFNDSLKSSNNELLKIIPYKNEKNF